MEKTVYLIGFMGSGKTSVGKELGEILNREVIDTDELIVQREQTTIPDIFKEHGETYFRQQESKILQELAGRDSLIVTTGGGIILNEKNRSILKAHNGAVYLHCDPKILVERLKGDTTRPLVLEKSDEEIIALYESRLSLYSECAAITIDTSNMTIEQAAKEVVNRLSGKEVG